MKLYDGPVTLEINGHGEQAGYLRWRDYHHSYNHGQAVVYVHQLSLIADGADPYKVFSDGAHEVNHTGDALDAETGPTEDAHKVKEVNSPENLELLTHVRHWNHHVHDDGDDEPDDGEPDYDAEVVEGVQKKRQELVLNSIKTLENGQGAPVEEVVDMATDVGSVDREDVEHDLEKLKMRGEIYEPRTDHLRAV